MCWHRTGGQKLLSLPSVLICSGWLISCGCKPQPLLWFNQCAAFREGELKEKWKQFTRGEEWKEIPVLPVALKFVAVWPGPTSHRLQMFPIWQIPSGGEQERRPFLSLVNGYPWLGGAAVSQRVQTWVVPVWLACLLPVGREAGLPVAFIEKKGGEGGFNASCLWVPK